MLKWRQVCWAKNRIFGSRGGGSDVNGNDQLLRNFRGSMIAHAGVGNGWYGSKEI
jgi:hypothetical protein